MNSNVNDRNSGVNAVYAALAKSDPKSDPSKDVTVKSNMWGSRSITSNETGDKCNFEQLIKKIGEDITTAKKYNDLDKVKELKTVLAQVQKLHGDDSTRLFKMDIMGQYEKKQEDINEHSRNLYDIERKILAKKEQKSEGYEPEEKDIDPTQFKLPPRAPQPQPQAQGTTQASPASYIQNLTPEQTQKLNQFKDKLENFLVNGNKLSTNQKQALEVRFNNVISARSEGQFVQNLSTADVLLNHYIKEVGYPNQEQPKRQDGNQPQGEGQQPQREDRNQPQPQPQPQAQPQTQGSTQAKSTDPIQSPYITPERMKEYNQFKADLTNFLAENKDNLTAGQQDKLRKNLVKLDKARNVGPDEYTFNNALDAARMGLVEMSHEIAQQKVATAEAKALLNKSATDINALYNIYTSEIKTLTKNEQQILYNEINRFRMANQAFQNLNNFKNLTKEDVSRAAVEFQNSIMALQLAMNNVKVMPQQASLDEQIFLADLLYHRVETSCEEVKSSPVYFRASPAERDFLTNKIVEWQEAYNTLKRLKTSTNLTQDAIDIAVAEFKKASQSALVAADNMKNGIPNIQVPETKEFNLSKLNFENCSDAEKAQLESAFKTLEDNYKAYATRNKYLSDQDEQIVRLEAAFKIALNTFNDAFEEIGLAKARANAPKATPQEVAQLFKVCDSLVVLQNEFYLHCSDSEKKLLDKDNYRLNLSKINKFRKGSQVDWNADIKKTEINPSKQELEQFLSQARSLRLKFEQQVRDIEAKRPAIVYTQPVGNNMDRQKAMEVLGLNDNFTSAQLKRSYAAKALAAHPDKNNGNDEPIKTVNNANQVLQEVLRVRAGNPKYPFAESNKIIAESGINL